MIQLTARYIGFRNFLFCYLKRKNYNIRNKTLPPASYVYETWFLPLRNKSTIHSVWKQVTRKLLQLKTEKVLRIRRKLYEDQLRKLWPSSDPSTMIKWKRKAIYVKQNFVACSHNHCYRGKEIRVTYCGCVFVALVMSMKKRNVVLYCHLWPAPLYHIFPHYLINGMILGKKLLNTKCLFWFTLQIMMSETFLILRRIHRDIIINLHRSSCKVLVILVTFWRSFNFLYNFCLKYFSF